MRGVQREAPEIPRVLSNGDGVPKNRRNVWFASPTKRRSRGGPSKGRYARSITRIVRNRRLAFLRLLARFGDLLRSHLLRKRNEILLSLGISLRSRHFIPHIGTKGVRRLLTTFFVVKAPQQLLGVGVSLFRGKLAPLSRFLLALWNAQSQLMHHRDLVLRECIAFFRKRAKELHRCRIFLARKGRRPISPAVRIRYRSICCQPEQEDRRCQSKTSEYSRGLLPYALSKRIWYASSVSGKPAWHNRLRASVSAHGCWS